MAMANDEKQDNLVTMIKVRGLQIAEARRQLRSQIGVVLKSENIYRVESYSPDGEVLQTRPRPGEAFDPSKTEVYVEIAEYRGGSLGQETTAQSEEGKRRWGRPSLPDLSRAGRARREGKLADALSHYAKTGKSAELLKSLREEIPASPARESLINAVEQFFRLRESVALARRTRLPEIQGLVDPLLRDVDDTGRGLWAVSENIAMAAAHRVNSQQFAQRQHREADKLDALTDEMFDARSAIAELTLGVRHLSGRVWPPVDESGANQACADLDDLKPVLITGRQRMRAGLRTITAQTRPLRYAVNTSRSDLASDPIHRLAPRPSPSPRSVVRALACQ